MNYSTPSSSSSSSALFTNQSMSILEKIVKLIRKARSGKNIELKVDCPDKKTTLKIESNTDLSEEVIRKHLLEECFKLNDA